jgi:hypothetical protein
MPERRPRFRVVISAEANSYMAWQAKLAHFSCLTRLRQAPLIVIHEADGASLDEFGEIEHTGGTLLRAPSYRVNARGLDYAPRNVPGTLLEAARVGPRTEYLMLCDPDVIFLRPFQLRGRLSAAACGYLDYAEPPVRAAMRRLGIAPGALGAARGRSLHCGIPYIIPWSAAEPLALAWLEAIDAFRRPRWEDQMHAFGLAVTMLKLRLRRRPLADTNYEPGAPTRAPLVHYCYGNALWSKRRFLSRRTARRVWRPPNGAVPGSILAAVFRELVAARQFYESRRPRPSQTLSAKRRG